MSHYINEDPLIKRERQNEEIEKHKNYLAGVQRNVNSLLSEDERTAFDMKGKSGYDPALYSKKRIKKETEYISDLLSDTQTSKELKISDAQLKRLRSIRTRGLSFLLLNEHSRSDSPEMADVKYNVQALEELLDNQRGQKITKELYEEIQVRYQLALHFCRTYVNNPRKRENARKKAVRATMQALLFESDRLAILRRDMEQNKLSDKTVADLIGLDSKAEPVRPKELGPMKKPKALSKDGKAVSALFSNTFKPSNEIGKEWKMDWPLESKKYIELKNALRKIPEGKVIAFDATLMGKNVRLLQRSDNSLCIIENNREYPLEITAPLLADKIEIDMVQNQEMYGKANILKMFANLDLHKDDNNIGDRKRIRQMLNEFLEKNTGIATADFSNFPLDQLRKVALQIGRETLSIDELKGQFRDYQVSIDTKINTEEAIDMLGRVDKNLVSVNKMVTIDKKQAADQPFDENKEFSEDEQKVLNMFADMFFDEKTWTTDSNILNEPDAMRKRLFNHTGALQFFIQKPEEMKKMIERLPLPKIVEDGKDLKTQLLEGYNEMVEDEAFSILKDMNFLAFNSTIALLTSPTLGDEITVPVKKGEGLFGIPIFESEKKSVKPFKEMFEKMTKSMNKYVDLISNNLQDSVTDAVNELFGKDDEEIEAEIEEKEKQFIKAKEERDKRAEQRKKDEETREVQQYLNAVYAGEKNEEVINVEQPVEDYEKDKLQKNQDELAEDYEEFEMDKLQNEKRKAQRRKAKKAEEKKDLEENGTLDKMMEALAKGEAGQGKFNKLILKNYFKSVSQMDKRCMIASMIRSMKP